MRSEELEISGKIFSGDDFEEIDGYLVIDEGRIKEISSGRCGDENKNVIIPSFINAHTHIGDSVSKEVEWLPLDKLVGPGGLKEKILSEASYEMLSSSMADTIADMFECGILMFADFREGGIKGVEALKDALSIAARGNRCADVKIFGRPGENEEKVIFAHVDGIGLSSTADHGGEYLRLLSEEAKKRGKLFALHAGERNASDIEDAIDLEPDFLVHLVNASDRDIRRLKEKDIGVVVCIRSNLVTRSGLPPVRKMLDEGLTIGIGTDNVMLNSPNIFSEMEFMSKLFDVDEKDVLRMCTINGARILQEEREVGTIEEGKKANLLVIKMDSPNMRNVRNVIKGIVRRGRADDIRSVIYEGKIFNLS